MDTTSDFCIAVLESQANMGDVTWFGIAYAAVIIGGIFAALTFLVGIPLDKANPLILSQKGNIVFGCICAAIAVAGYIAAYSLRLC